MPDESFDFWLYVSVSNIAKAEERSVISNIVNFSRSRNATLAITGSLLFTATHFAQFIEGPRGGLEPLKSSILNDMRHRDVTTISEGTSVEREFCGWSMAFGATGPYLDGLVAWSRDRQPANGRSLLLRLMRRMEAHGLLDRASASPYR